MNANEMKFNRATSDAIFIETLNDLDNLNTRDGRFEYADYVTLHNDVTALYDSFMHVDCLIESLQARADQAALNYQQKCRDVAELEAQLAKSQHRADAAVEDMTAMSNMTEDAELCVFCKWGAEDECEYPGETNGMCFTWRGPQEAGEGGRDERTPKM